MRNEELIALILSGDYKTAADRLKTEKSRLSTPSASHPVFDLLRAYTKLRSVSGYYSFIYKDFPEEEKDQKEEEMVDLLGAMLDAKMDPQMEINKLSSWSNDQEERGRIGIAPNGNSYSQQDYSDHTLYSRLASLGWTSAMTLLLKRGVIQNDKQITSAFWNASKSRSEKGLRFLLDHHVPVPANPQRKEDDIMEALMQWDGVDHRSVSEMYDRYDNGRVLYWASLPESANVVDRTSVEWLSFLPGKWEDVHQQIVKRFDGKVHRNASLFPALLNEYVRTGDFGGLVDEALSGPSFKGAQERYAGGSRSPLSSLITQGHSLDLAEKRNNDWDKQKDERNASFGRFAQIRRAVKVYRKLRDKGAPFMTAEHPTFSTDKTVATEWAKVGWVPTAATIKRHPYLLLPAMDGTTPIHSASTVETALGWEKLGVASTPTHEGADPWVLGMQSAALPVPWAREIAARLKDGRVDIAAKGKAGKSLAYLSAKSPPLARFVLKKSKAPLSPDMLSGAIEEEQWSLISEWVKSGELDHRPEMRALVCEIFKKLPTYSATDAARQKWRELISLIPERPNAPWPEQKEAWRNRAGPNSWVTSSSSADHHNFATKVLSKWGQEARRHWEERDWEVLLGKIKSGNHWPEYCPIEPSVGEATDLAWTLLLEPEVGTSSRYQSLSHLIDGIGEPLSLRNAGPAAFEALDRVNEAAPYEFGAGQAKASVQAILDAERLAATTSVAAAKVGRSGPRL